MSFGCAKDKVKPSADSLLYAETLNSINKIKTAYEEKNKGVLQNHLYHRVAGDIMDNLVFEKAELSFTLRLLRIKESSVTANINWHGSWWIASNDKIESRGVADLVLERETMKVLQIDGDNPFLIPSRRY